MACTLYICEIEKGKVMSRCSSAETYQINTKVPGEHHSCKTKTYF